VNRVASGGKSDLNPGSAAAVWNGDGTCPNDRQQLLEADKDTVPEGVQVKKCGTCGWWWFPTDSLFAFEQAYEVKNAYRKVWSGKKDWWSSAWPAVAMVVLAVGLVGGVGLTMKRQQSGIFARAGVKEFAAVYTGGGKTEISFVFSGEIAEIRVRQVGKEWWRLPIERADGVYKVETGLLEVGQEYEVEIAGQTYTFLVK